LIVNYLFENDIGFVKHTDNFLSRFQHFCHVCSLGFDNGRGWKAHLDGRRHQNNQFKCVIIKNDRASLVKDKVEVCVTSIPLCDLNGNISVKVEVNNELIIPFYIKINNQDYSSYSVNPLYDNKYFELDSSVVNEKGLLKNDLKFKISHEFGHHFYPIFFKFDNFKDYKSIYILRIISLDVVGKMYSKLQVKEEYKKKELIVKPKLIQTIEGIKLSRVKNCLLNFKEIKSFPIPIKLKELFDDNDLKMVLKDTNQMVKIENYINYFQVLLHAEEYQLDKDIRYYDMKGVQFNNASHDKFLHLNVPNVFENRPAVCFFFIIYIY
jgi:hypothetical protein